MVETRSYDALGCPSNPQTGERLKEVTWLINNGYTEHEHLMEYRLINMQGRLYDPQVCRFLSPDPYIQSPENSQSYNRYAYCLNNPLMYKDPNGELFWFIAGAIIGAYIGGSAANHWKWNPTKWNFSNSDTWAYMAFGSLVGGFGGQLLLGPGGLIAGGSQLGVSIGAFVGNTFSGFATFAVSSSGVILQGVGYVTAAGGGVYVAFNQKLWNWDSGKKGKPEPKNYVETGGENDNNPPNKYVEKFEQFSYCYNKISFNEDAKFDFSKSANIQGYLSVNKYDNSRWYAELYAEYLPMNVALQPDYWGNISSYRNGKQYMFDNLSMKNEWGEHFYSSDWSRIGYARVWLPTDGDASIKVVLGWKTYEFWYGNQSGIIYQQNYNLKRR